MALAPRLDMHRVLASVVVCWFLLGGCNAAVDPLDPATSVVTGPSRRAAPLSFTTAAPAGLRWIGIDPAAPNRLALDDGTR
jgi:hypothetical protein